MRAPIWSAPCNEPEGRRPLTQRCSECSEYLPGGTAPCPACAKALSVQEAKRKAIEAELREVMKDKDRDEAFFMNSSEQNAKLRRRKA